MNIPVKATLQQKPLGTTGLWVSEMSLGTVELGLDYGIPAPGQYGRPSEGEAIRLLEEAVDSGVTLFDTAPTYGEGERLLGQALGQREEAVFATKFPLFQNETGIPLGGWALRSKVEKSLHASLRALRRDVLDIVQIHNATVDILLDGEILELLVEAKQKGMIRHIGATVYQEEEALAALQTGEIEVLQISYNILDQRMAKRVFPQALKAGVGIVARSVLLKGALTEKVQWLPSSLYYLKETVEQVKDCLHLSWETLPQTALRFCISHPAVSTALLGVRTRHELSDAIGSIQLGKLESTLLSRAETCACEDEALINPRTWPIA